MQGRKRDRTSTNVKDGTERPVRSRLSGGMEVAEEESFASMSALSTVASGRCFSLAISSEGRVMTWGKNSAGQMGTGSDADQHHPAFVAGMQNERCFTGVACGNFHALAVTDAGNVYAWGSNARGRLGIGHTTSKELVPVPIPRYVFGMRSVVSVGCGLHHSVFLLEDGSCFSAGCNENGQLGRPQGFRAQGASPAPAPVSLAPGVRIVRIASGRHHVLALSASGELYGWGKNDVGQVGVPGQNGDIPMPQRIAGQWRAPIKMFDAGRNHSMVACVDDTLWAFGQNVDLQLGFSDRADRMFPVEVDRFRGISLKQIACGSRQTVAITKGGALWVWGWILHESEQGMLNFSPVPPMKYLEGPLLALPLALVSAGSTHIVLVQADGTVQVVGENSDNALCIGPIEHAEKVYPPAYVNLTNGERFKVALPLRDAPVKHSSLGAHLMHVLQSSFESNVKLVSPTGDEYRLHKFVLAVRCPKLLMPGVVIPASRDVCKQLFDYIYGQQCDLSHLKARELVQLIQTLQDCAPHLGRLATKAERTFVQLISNDKEETLRVAQMAEIMTSNLGEWVKLCLSDHLKNGMDASEAARVPPNVLAQVAVSSHQKNVKRPEIMSRDEQSLEVAFVAAMADEQYSDFCITFASLDEAPLNVHACMVARMEFFAALIRNLRLGRSGRSFVSQTPRSAMLALLRYVYGGEPTFSAWDALHLMSPENGVAFYFASSTESNAEVELISDAAQVALSQMNVSEAVDGLLRSQQLGIPQAEAVLIDLIADNYLEAEELLDSVQGEGVLLSIQRQIIRSLLLRHSSGGGTDPNTTQLLDESQ